LPKSSNSLQVQYETSQIGQGVEILELLGKFLIEEYSRFVAFFQNEIKKDLNIAFAEIKKNKFKKKSNEINIINIEKRINELETGLIFVNKNTDFLNKERKKLLSSAKNENQILSVILYTNTIQQNLQLANDYMGEMKDLKLEKEIILQDTSELEGEIQKHLAEIDDLELKKKNIQNIQIIQKPNRGLYPIKPKKVLNVTLATIIGIFLMIFLSFIIEFIINPNLKKTNETQ
jgi:LPS O-antigen subunit length determinant protein (WzzB/FepE family)